MKKIIIALVIISFIFTCFDIYEFSHLNKLSATYQESKNKYHELLELQSANDNKIAELNNTLDEIKASNAGSSKEYQIWLNLNKKIQDLLK